MYLRRGYACYVIFVSALLFEGENSRFTTEKERNFDDSSR